MSGSSRGGWYLERHPDVARAGVDPILHYVLHGADAGYFPHPLFDSLYDLHSNEDVRSEGLNPYLHFLQVGAEEGRRPNSWFDP